MKIRLYQIIQILIQKVRNNKNNLYWREPGIIELQQVPAGDVAYVYNQNTCKGRWISAEPGRIPTELTNYNFNIINSMNQEKHQVEKQNEKQRKEAGKEILKNEKVKKGLKKLFKR